MRAAARVRQRLIQRGMEEIGDTIPAPWGPRIEFVFREIGGLIWLQITLLVIGLRMVLSSGAAIVRFFKRGLAENRRPSTLRTDHRRRE
jgi:hypothetical protein